MDLIVDIATMVIAVGVAYAISLLLKKQQASGDNSHFISREKELSSELKSEREKNESLNNEIGQYKSEIKFLNEKLENQKQELEELNEKFTKEFELLANKIFDEKSEKFTKQNETKLQDILKPLKIDIDEFKNQLRVSNETNIERSTLLTKHLEDMKNMHNQMSEETSNLTKALKGDAKKQGDWGELQLDKILEFSGLEKGKEYIKQGKDMDLTDEDGNRLQPDVIIMLPDNKHIIIDSKVSLIEYTRYIEAEDENKDEHIANIARDIRNHIKELGDKKYEAIGNLDSPDYVLMFIPIEATFSMAVNKDPELWSFAWDKRIVMVSPSTLLAVLKTVSSLWNQDKQNQNVEEIAQQAGALYDKFVGFIDDLDSIGKSIANSDKAYQGALNKLSSGKGNLVGRAEKIKKLGAKTKKAIPQKLLQEEV